MRSCFAPATQRIGLLAAVLAIAAISRPAAAHVVAAPGQNNRYLKLSVLGDRIRLAYTVLYGEAPGKALRAQIDTNHDGAIDDAESEAFGKRIAPRIAAAIDLTVDGVHQPIAWSQIVVGLATPSAAGGAFSVDLVAWLCLAAPRGVHAVLFRDDYPLDSPGETEVKVEDSPGVRINRTEIDGAVDEDHDYNLVGPSGALATQGLELAFTAGPTSIAAPDAICPGPAPTGGISLGLIIGAAIGAIAVGTAAALLVMLRARRRTSHQSGRQPGRPRRRATDGSTRRRSSDR